MKNLILITVCALPAVPAAGQKLEFFPNEVRGLEKTFTLNGTAGESTMAKNLWLYNRTGQTLRVYARPHVEYGVLYFFDGRKTIHERSLEIAPGAKASIQLFGYLNSTAAQNCKGYVALAATPLNANGQPGLKNTVKLPVAVNFKAPSVKSAQPVSEIWNKPDRYEAIMMEAMPLRWHLKHLPLKVYSKHVNTGDTATQYDAVVQRAVVVWNKVGRDNGMDRDFFRIVHRSKGADIQVIWTGQYLLPGSNGTAYPSEGRIGMLPLGRYGGLGKAGETLMQELCHMLGVAHSEVRLDIMFTGGHSHSPELSKLGVTERDKQMLAWLYSQTSYVPLKE
ncbi:MAG: hypothetical protein ACKVT2_02925 [Saprospiraceae bacterium]